MAYGFLCFLVMLLGGITFYSLLWQELCIRALSTMDPRSLANHDKRHSMNGHEMIPGVAWFASLCSSRPIPFFILWALLLAWSVKLCQSLLLPLFCFPLGSIPLLVVYSDATSQIDRARRNQNLIRRWSAKLVLECVWSGGAFSRFLLE